MCEVCAEFLHLLDSCKSYTPRSNSWILNADEPRFAGNSDAKHSTLLKSEIETAFGYIQAWPQRQCMCLYRDVKNFERFNQVVQSMIRLSVHHLKHIERLINDYKRLTESAAQVVAQAAQQPAKTADGGDGDASATLAAAHGPAVVDSSDNETSKKTTVDAVADAKDDIDVENSDTGNVPPLRLRSRSSSSPPSAIAGVQHTEEPWILPEVEKLLLLVSKVFLLNFPLYIAYKHSTHARLDDISAEEAQHLSVFSDLHDNEIPVYLLRNISLFCNIGGFAAMMLCFEQPDLPVTTAHAITTTVSNIKLWLNYGCIVQLLVPLRSRVLQYMCQLSDQNLRSAATRAMADFVWSAARDPLDASVSFDVEGLALAFKYFTSTTLTMRLAGMSQINAHINLFNEICTTETVGEVEIVGQKIATWLTENQIIQHLFGPNLHVEVIKQAHVVLNFLAVENQITEEHIKLIWQATQLKHCSKTIFDILPSLVKNLAPRPAMHLYALLCRLDPKEHTEQSIYIASALTKLIWSRDNSRSQMAHLQEHLLGVTGTASSSESGSMDGSNSDDDQGNGDDSSLASGRKSPIDIENIGSDTGVTPCKQARRRRRVCDPTAEKSKQMSEEELNMLNPKVDMKMQNHRIVNIIDNSSSDDDIPPTTLDIPLLRKKSRKRRQNNNVPLKRLPRDIVHAIWDGGDEDATSDDADEADGEIGEVNDSDDCSESNQMVPSAVLKHLQGEGPYIRAIAETHISELLSGAENDGDGDGSYSSPLSIKSEKNLADFDDEDVSPCEEELAQLVSAHAPAFAAAAAAMAAAHTAMAMQKTEANVAVAAAAVAAAAVATGNAHQSLEVMRQQATVAAAAAAVVNEAAAAALKASAAKTSSSDMDMDTSEIGGGGKNSPKVSCSAVGEGGQQQVGQMPTFKINDVCQPGNTLLWDLLQDDKICQLGEALAMEAEKVLATLLCFSMDRQLRTKFIEGCLQNLAANRSVIVSLRLLPKLFSSFQQFRPTDTHHVTMWAERHHKMMYHFFNNMRFYAKRHAEVGGRGDEQPTTATSPIYSHKTQVSVRLHFLSSIFSAVGSPKSFRLNLDQVDALWEWLAHDAECADCYFSWLQSQAKGGDQHALGIDALQHLYLKKLPELRPEDFSMVGLGLFQQLCSLARLAMAHYEKQTEFVANTTSNIVGMFHLWKIALRAHNTEVSLAAIQYINMYYMGQQLRLEKEFVSQCMDNLVQAANALENNEDENALMCVQRGLMLLNTHLETFRRRYAFHLRRWAIEGKGIGSHSNLKNEGAGPAIRIVLQPAGLSEKSVLHMHACDLIADLKAEISKWWETLPGATIPGVTAPVLGLLLSEGPLRIITQGQELTSDYDERSLGDAGFKDNQIVYVSLGGRGARRKETNLDHPSMQPPPPKECLPTVLLLQPKYFEKLFCLMQTLGDMQPQSHNLQLHTKAQLLSRRVWDILAILPTNPMILDAFKSLSAELAACEQLGASGIDADAEAAANARKQINQKLTDLLDPSNLQKFMYSLHIVESLAVSSVLLQRGASPCCGAVGSAIASSINGNGSALLIEQQGVRASKGSVGAVGASKKAATHRRRNSNESLSGGAKEETKRSSNMSLESQTPKECASDSSSVARDREGTATGAATANDSDLSEAGSDARSSCNNDKENNPSSSVVVVRHNKRHKRCDCAPPPPLSTPLTAEERERLAPEAIEASSAAATRTDVAMPETAAVTASAASHDLKWSEAFVQCGGLRHLYAIFVSGQLQQSAHPRELLNEWRHDCLASLLRILWLLGFEEVPAEDAAMHVGIARPHAFMLELMEGDGCLRRLASVLNDEAYQNYASSATSATATPSPYQYHQYHHLRTGFWGRAQVVQFAMNIMVSFVHASAEARRMLWSQPDYCGWVLKFILEDPEPAVRREICAGLYRICLGNTQSYQVLLAPLLRKLLSFLPVAEKMTAYAQHTQFLLSDEGKEPYGPACRDYFWLLARLVDTLTSEMAKSTSQEDAAATATADAAASKTGSVSVAAVLRAAGEEPLIDIDGLCQSVSQSILSRDFYETRHGYQDDGLVGLINLMSNFVKYDPTYKFSEHALGFIDKIFEFLFDMPSPSNRQKPKCKSATSRAAAYDLLVELCKNCAKNYTFLHGKLLEQHKPGPKAPYPWDYWPRDEGRSECGYVGLTNLGATCYMASCIQHLYMMPQARATILCLPPEGEVKHGATLYELQRMFAYLLESERKAYNPRSFCRVYQMDHQPLNTGEQKDMAEFFIDLVSKLEEMTPSLKDLVKRLFCGIQSNNVVSLDCGHVSRTAEEFYTVRCQVADMRNLQESLDEVTVKDTLEGDNMYTCSQCGKKVRAEKRACFKKLPQILCFNTMRYTFNMVTMLKEKVNTHFSFPMRLNMSDYVEKTLMPHQYKEDREKRKQQLEQEKEKAKAKSTSDKGDADKAAINDDGDDFEDCLEYELVGVTVHTGTADGGHYYSFIKERTKSAMQHDRWFLFNDAEVKPFDPSQIAAECFGGEMTSKTYDSVTEKYLDFSFEKTNSAYMLFYERRLPEHLRQRHTDHLLAMSPERMSTADDGAGEGRLDASAQDAVVTKAKGSEGCEAQSNNGTALTGSRNDGGNTQSSDGDLKLCKEGKANICDSSSSSSRSRDVDKIEPQPSTSAAAAAAAVAGAVETEIERTGRSDRHVPLLSKELEDWIWQDNRQFLQDRNIFEHTYFNFMWQICGHIPQTLIAQSEVTCMAAKLSVSFFIETFIHAKEKPTMVPWVELLTKQFNASQDACEWFLSHMAIEPWWPMQVLIQCPNQMVRQMFQRLVIHVIQRLRPTHAQLFLKLEIDDDGKEVYGTESCVSRFIIALIALLENGAKVHQRHMSEYFGLLFEFSRMGEEETVFLLRVGVIKSVADFYLGNKSGQECIDVGSDNDDNSSDEALSVDKTRPASLDKMIALVATLVERSRGQDFRLRLTTRDYAAIAGGKGFPFLYQQIKDNINPHQTKHLIHALCRWDDRLANQIITMLFASVTKHTELCGPFFKLLTLLTETQGGPSGLPCFSQLVLQRVWDAAEYCPQSALDWLAFQAPKNKIAHSWVLQSAENWMEQFLLAHNNSRVRNAAAYLAVALVPSQPFRANFRTHSLHKLAAVATPAFRELNNDAQIILHNIINILLRLLRAARTFAEVGAHGTTKLTAYFSLLSYCMVTKTEKLMIGPFMRSLWDLFHPRLSEPSVPAHHNKHALLAFWHHALTDCPENAQIIANCPEITRNIAFNYILADHEDSEIVTYNRSMLPAYYGLLRMCCEQSRVLTRQLAAHQNLQWAFKNITPHPTQYPAAVDELFKLMALFATRHPESSEQERHEVISFRRTTLSAYLQGLDARVSWSTLLSALRILVDNDEDRLLVIYNGGIEMCFEALHTLHSMHHEATACHVVDDIQELLGELVLLLQTLRLSTRLDSPTPSKSAALGSPTQQQHHTAQQKVQQQQQQFELQAQQLQLLQKQQQEQLQKQSAMQTPQQQQQQQKEKLQLQQQMQQHIQLQQMQLQQQQQHFLRQQHQHTQGLLKGLPEAIKRLATLLNTYNPPEICRLAIEALKEMVRNSSLDITSILAPILTNCHVAAANTQSAIGPLGPYFPRRGAKNTWPKTAPRPPRAMVQMAIPRSEIATKGVDIEYDTLLEVFYRPYHDFIDVMMRMAVNTNTLNDTLVKLSCLVATEAAPLHFNLFPKFWVGIYNNKTTNKYSELLVGNPLLVEYIHKILRDERVSLSDQYIRNFLEIYYPKIAEQLPISRLLYTISYSMHSKEDLDDLCGDLFAIRVIAQCTGIPTSARKQLRGSLRALLNKGVDYQKMAESELLPNKKIKLESDAQATATVSGVVCVTSRSESAATEPMETTPISDAAANGSVKGTAQMDCDCEGGGRASVVAGANKEKASPANDKEPSAPVVSISVVTPAAAAAANATNATATATATSSKNINKKTADDRQLEEHEKRIKLLLTMETYIKSILALMQKEEANSSPREPVPFDADDDSVGEDKAELDAAVLAAVAVAAAKAAAAVGSSSASDDGDDLAAVDAAIAVVGAETTVCDASEQQMSTVAGCSHNDDDQLDVGIDILVGNNDRAANALAITDSDDMCEFDVADIILTAQRAVENRAEIAASNQIITKTTTNTNATTAKCTTSAATATTTTTGVAEINAIGSATTTTTTTSTTMTQSSTSLMSVQPPPLESPQI